MRKGVVVKAVLYNSAGEVLLVRRSKTAPRRPLQWDFPGGYVDGDDVSFQAACLREVREEAGLAVVNNHLILAVGGSMVSTSGDEPMAITWLYFEGVAAGSTVTLSYEHDTFTWVTLERALELIEYDRQLNAIRYLLETR